MIYWEIATGFIAGLILLILICWLFKAKMRWYLRFFLSSALGALILLAFNLFNLVALPFNALNAFIIGFLGIFGVALLAVVTLIF